MKAPESATILLSLGVGFAGCHRSAPPAAAAATPASTLVATYCTSPPTLDGELTDAAWLAAPRTARFVDARSGHSRPPYSEARALWDADSLYLGLYAGDIDLEPSDRMGAILRGPSGETHIVELDPSGRIRWHAPGAPAADAPAGVRAVVDADGTLSNPHDDDEEWVVEARVPWRALGLRGPTDLRVNFFRRDTPRGLPMAQLAWVAWGEHQANDLAFLGALRRSPH